MTNYDLTLCGWIVGGGRRSYVKENITSVQVLHLFINLNNFWQKNKTIFLQPEANTIFKQITLIK